MKREVKLYVVKCQDGKSSAHVFYTGKPYDMRTEDPWKAKLYKKKNHASCAITNKRDYPNVYREWKNAWVTEIGTLTIDLNV